jgi:haloalkane dehalogenase
VIASNTILPQGKGEPNEAFMQWRNFSQSVPEFPVSGVINMGTTSKLSPETLAAYDAPFPDERYKEGARIFPALVPILSDEPEAINNQKAWKVLSEWEKPFLTLFGDADPIMKGMEKLFLNNIPGTKGQPHMIIENAGHFLQEDKGEDLATLSVNFIKTS